MKFSQWLALAAVLAAGILIWNLRDVLLHLFAGIVLAMALCTLIGEVRSRQSMPRSIALIFCLSLILLLLGISIAIVLPPFTSEFQQLLMQLPVAAKKLWTLSIGSLDNLSNIIYGNSSERIWDQRLFPIELNPFPDGGTLATGITEGIEKLLGLAGNLGSGLIQILFVLAVALMVTAQPAAYREAAILLLPSFYRRRARAILLQCGEALSSWMVGVLISSSFVAILAGIGLSILGVKLVVANALLAGILNVIPNIGPTIGTIFPVSVALLDAPWKAFAVIGLYIFIQNMESYIITPSVMQHQVKLLPGLTLTAQFVFTIIFGPLGLLLALPLAVILQVIIREVIVHDLLDPWKKERLAR